MATKTKLDIAMVVPGLPMHARSLTEHSLGGSETAGLSMALELARLGHHVKLFCNTPQLHMGQYKLELVPINMFKQFGPVIPQDVMIVQRKPGVFGSAMPTKLNLLWVHDLGMLRVMPELMAAAWNIDRILAVSQWHAKQYAEIFGLPQDRVIATRNGISISMAPAEVARNPKQIVYTARPERGLDVLLEKIMPLVWERDPDVRLLLAAYDNQVPELAELYARISAAVEASKGKARFLGFLKKPDLYRLYSESALYAYATPSPLAPEFREVSCITAMECMLCGLPFLSFALGALPETLAPQAGKLLDGSALDPDGPQRFADTMLDLLRDQERLGNMGREGRKAGAKLDWSHVAEEWTELFCREIEAKSKNTDTVARWFIRQSDIEAAAAMKVSPDIDAQIEAGWGWRNDPAATREHYAKIGTTHTDIWPMLQADTRLPTIKKMLGQLKGRVLDYACGLGAITVNLANELPGLEFVGADFDPHAIEWGEKYRTDPERCKRPDGVEFRVITGPESFGADEKFDALILGEVLEHVPEPWLLVEKLEAHLNPGAIMIVTTPWGPWEEESYHTYPYRCHIWELTLHDLRDMFGHKPGLAIEQFGVRPSQLNGQPLGITITTWRHIEPGCKPINMTRKTSLVAPRQTVSVLMICGAGAELTLDWCLSSVWLLADEIVIGDTGMNDDGRRIAAKYGARIVPAPDPREAGFDESRNAVLDHCRMDWILWIDSDERLVNAERLHKYLRASMYDGFGLRQHHFSVDTQVKPDLPVRLFRRELGLRFFGVCHEHPEKELNAGPGRVIVISDVHIAHVGYLSEAIRRDRFVRNYPLMEQSHKKYPNRLLNYFFSMRDNMILNMYEVENSNGKVTASALERCRKVIDTWREHFRGKSNYMSDEALKYYSDAVRMLGIGAETVFAAKADKEGTPQPQMLVARFACAEDFELEMKGRAKASMEPFDNPMW